MPCHRHELFKHDASEAVVNNAIRHSCHNPLHCIISPHILKHLANSSDKIIREIAFKTMALTEHLRGRRNAFASIPGLGLIPRPQVQRQRLV